MSEQLSPDDTQSLAFMLKRVEVSQSSVNALMEHFGMKYGMKQGDQVAADGKIMRAPKV